MRQNWKNILFVILSVVFLCTCFTACNGNGAMMDSIEFNPTGTVMENSFGGSEYYDYKVEGNSGATNSNTANIEQTGQKLVYTASLGIETKDYDSSIESVRHAVSEMNGYIENTDAYSYNGTNRNIYFKIRVPVESYNDFLNTVCEIGSVRRKSENVEDITRSYLDVEARLSSLEAKMGRLKELQKEAENLDQLLAIENQISDTQYQIESYTSQLNHMKNRVSYCTVELDLEEVAVYTEKPSFANEIIETHSETIEGFVRLLKDFVLFIISVYPYVILCGAIAFAVKKIRKNKNGCKRKFSIPKIKKNKKA